MEYESFRIDGVETPLASTRHRDLVCSVLDQSIWLRGLTVWDHFRLFAPVKECQRALELFDIEHLAYRIPATLSTGQRQRANLASTLVRPWRVLLLDEPESGLDEEHQGILAATYKAR
ncbi:ATP-binding cassette domain-containing protein [Scrofimicrobium canadense]|nr:ATP-binding cassette domain-containing protein [Scrofimicrobium canadense]